MDITTLQTIGAELSTSIANNQGFNFSLMAALSDTIVKPFAIIFNIFMAVFAFCFYKFSTSQRKAYLGLHLAIGIVGTLGLATLSADTQSPMTSEWMQSHSGQYIAASQWLGKPVETSITIGNVRDTVQILDKDLSDIARWQRLAKVTPNNADIANLSLPDRKILLAAIRSSTAP